MHPRCQQPLVDVIDPANEFAFVAMDPVRCHYCTARDQKAAELRDAVKSGALTHAEALIIPVVRR